MWEGDFWRIPFGMPGVETMVPLTFTHGPAAGRFSINHWVKLVSENPAKLFGIYPQKGIIAPGSDADIVIWDPDKKVKYGVAHARHRTDYNLYEGWNLVGYPNKVFLRGKLIVDNGQWFGKGGMGRFLKRTSGEIL